MKERIEKVLGLEVHNISKEDGYFRVIVKDKTRFTMFHLCCTGVKDWAFLPLLESIKQDLNV